MCPLCVKWRLIRICVKVLPLNDVPWWEPPATTTTGGGVSFHCYMYAGDKLEVSSQMDFKVLVSVNRMTFKSELQISIIVEMDGTYF